MLYALWHGGNGFSRGDLERDLETFPNRAALKAAFLSRRENGSWQPQDVHYADGRTESVIMPDVSDDAEAHVFLSDPRGSDDPYPDFIVSFGPRGGVKIDRV